MKKTILLALFLPILVTIPAVAQFGNVWSDFKAYSVDLQNYLNFNIRETLNPLDLYARIAIESAKGDSNIPNPIKTREILRSTMLFNSTSDKFENNSAVRNSLVSDEIDRLITRGAVESFMGSSGQIRYKSKLENTEITLDNISNVSREADDIVTQIMGISPDSPFLSELLGQNQANLNLQTIKIQSEQAKIMAESLAQTMQNNQFLQYSNLNLTNISKQVEQTNRAERVETSTEAARLLRTSSQIDLFGRKY